MFLGLTPFLVFIVSYNMIRFDHPLEFGQIYALDSLDMKNWGFRFKDVAFALWGYLTEAPTYLAHFPFMRVSPFRSGLFENFQRMNRFTNNGTIGLIYCAPILFIFIPFYLRQTLKSPSTLWISGWLGTACCTLITCSMFGITIRYEMEILLILLGPLSSYLLSIPNQKGWKQIIHVLFFSSIVYASSFGFFSAYSVQFDDFKFNFPEMFNIFNLLYG